MIDWCISYLREAKHGGVATRLERNSARIREQLDESESAPNRN